MKKKFGWHFIDGDKLRDGTTAPADGKWLEYKGELAMCQSGLHFSNKPHEALEYAPGATLCLIEYGGKVIMGYDKGVCSRRKIIARMDATELLQFYARMQAIKTLEYWDTEPPEVVCDYLMTGDGSLRSAAASAAESAAESAAQAAWGAAKIVARIVAEVAWRAAESAARIAANKEFDSLVYECFENFL